MADPQRGGEKRPPTLSCGRRSAHNNHRYERDGAVYNCPGSAGHPRKKPGSSSDYCACEDTWHRIGESCAEAGQRP